MLNVHIFGLQKTVPPFLHASVAVLDRSWSWDQIFKVLVLFCNRLHFATENETHGGIQVQSKTLTLEFFLCLNYENTEIEKHT